jgi:O-antigen/teichoic acid export membrane protein
MKLEIETFTLEVSHLWKDGLRKVLSRPFVQHVGILTIASFVQAMIGFVKGILVARWLGPELYGVAALIMSYPGLVYTFFDARSVEASVKYLSQFHAKGEKERALAMCKFGYLVDIAIAVLSFSVVAITAGLAAERIVHRSGLTPLILVYTASLIPRAFVGISYAVMATLGHFPQIAAIEVTTAILSFALVLGMVASGLGVAGVIWGNAIATGLMGVLYGIFALHFIQAQWEGHWWKGTWSGLRGYRREIVRFLAFTDLNALLGMIPKQLDVILLGYFRNPTEVGYYKLAKSLSGAVGYLVGPLQSVTYPELARLWSLGNKDGLRRRVCQLAWKVGMPLGAAVLLGTALVPFLLPILVGFAYRPAAFATQILLAGSAVWLAFFWLRPLYFATGHLRKWVIGIGIYAVSFIALSVLTVPRFGYVGMTLSLLVVIVIFHICMGGFPYGARIPSRSAL